VPLVTISLLCLRSCTLYYIYLDNEQSVLDVNYCFQNGHQTKIKLSRIYIYTFSKKYNTKPVRDNTMTLVLPESQHCWHIMHHLSYGVDDPLPDPTQVSQVEYVVKLCRCRKHFKLSDNITQNFNIISEANQLEINLAGWFSCGDMLLINCTIGGNYCNSGSPSECHVSYLTFCSCRTFY